MAQPIIHRAAVHPERTQRHPVSQHSAPAEIRGSSTRVTGGRAQLEWDRSHGDP
jgi:hypothetical protein